jgi:Anti-sigma factor NepR
MPKPKEYAQSRAIRVLLGQQLRAYYDVMQHAPPPDRLAKLMESLSEKLEAENSKPK